MLRIAGKLTSLRGRFLSPTSSQAINLRKIRQLTPELSIFKNSICDERKEAFQDREIFLLFDMRTPLPGNTGISPFLLRDRNVIRRLPPPSGKNCDLLSVPTPEERYNSVLVQDAIHSGSKILFSSKNIEFKGYTCPELLKQDFKDLFPHKDLKGENLTVITICVETKHDMSTWSEESEAEREKHVDFFKIAAYMIVEYLYSFHHWAEFVHPSTGTLISHRKMLQKGKEHPSPITNATMYQTDMRYTKLGFAIEDLGCCRIISHPKWGTNMFHGAIFTNASVNSMEVKALLKKIFLKGLYMYKTYYEL